VGLQPAMKGAVVGGEGAAAQWVGGAVRGGSPDPQMSSRTPLRTAPPTRCGVAPSTWPPLPPTHPPTPSPYPRWATQTGLAAAQWCGTQQRYLGMPATKHTRYTTSGPDHQIARKKKKERWSVQPQDKVSAGGLPARPAPCSRRRQLDPPRQQIPGWRNQLATAAGGYRTGRRFSTQEHSLHTWGRGGVGQAYCKQTIADPAAWLPPGESITCGWAAQPGQHVDDRRQQPRPCPLLLLLTQYNSTTADLPPPPHSIHLPTGVAAPPRCPLASTQPLCYCVVSTHPLHTLLSPPNIVPLAHPLPPSPPTPRGKQLTS
jgi:hypothetical protein